MQKAELFGPTLFAVVVSFLLLQNCSVALEDAVDGERLRLMVQQRDLGGLRAITDEAEGNWLATPRPEYFERMFTICRALAIVAHTDANIYLYLQDVASRLLTKPWASGPGASNQAWAARRDVALMLAEEPRGLCVISPEAYATLRCRNAAFLALFCAQVKAVFKKDYTLKSSFLNVSPPLNIDNELLVAGMDPKGIRNPTSRKAYEDALEENKRNAAENSIQHMLKLIVDYELPRILAKLDALYSHAPANPKELAVYRAMALGDERPKELRKGP